MILGMVIGKMTIDTTPDPSVCILFSLILVFIVFIYFHWRPNKNDDRQIYLKSCIFYADVVRACEQDGAILGEPVQAVAARRQRQPQRPKVRQLRPKHLHRVGGDGLAGGHQGLALRGGPVHLRLGQKRFPPGGSLHAVGLVTDAQGRLWLRQVQGRQGCFLQLHLQLLPSVILRYFFFMN